ncbi:glycosyltransferase family 2 protein [Haloferula rosea]|uniref:Glycosyltransferase family 2 protein n=1 Tax=Haloferula rosea TaxID=490093 RepID=A0A934RGU0_9BACT|nr:glycosyltransferase family 2 protein [Haloferula rosea]MBK1828909.1 glycosyltransferase family 2 protein [Haloferula rosea]
MDDPPLSIIVAAFNEEDSIGATLEDLRAHVPAGTEVLVVDGGRDGTGRIVREFAGRMPGLRYIAHADDRGKGHAIRTGMREARGLVQAQFDGDGQFLAKDLAALVGPIETGAADLVLGSRFMAGSGRDEEATWTRDLGNWLVSGWASVLFGSRMTDVLAGVKAWSREAVTVVEPRSDTFEYEVEIPARALKGGLRVIEVPVSTRARTCGESKVSVLRVGMKVLAATVRFRWS